MGYNPGQLTNNNYSVWIALCTEILELGKFLKSEEKSKGV